MTTIVQVTAVFSELDNNDHVKDDYKNFIDDLIKVIKSGESGQLNPANASECFTFYLSGLGFRRSLVLAGSVDKQIHWQIKSMINEHLNWARERLYLGLCCYISDEMYPTIPESCLRDMATVFRTAVIHKKFNVHQMLRQFIKSQCISTILLALEHIEYESETITLMRKLHHIAMKTLFKHCGDWYKETVPTWAPEPVRQIYYTYSAHMWLDTPVTMQPITYTPTDITRVVPIYCIPDMTNDVVRASFEGVEFSRFEFPTFTLNFPKFSVININGRAHHEADITAEQNSGIKEAAIKLDQPINKIAPAITLSDNIAQLLQMCTMIQKREPLAKN